MLSEADLRACAKVNIGTCIVAIKLTLFSHREAMPADSAPCAALFARLVIHICFDLHRFVVAARCAKLISGGGVGDDATQ